MYAVLESLEFRQLLTAATPTDYEQYMLELLNRARLDPVAEAARLGITINEGLPDGTISPTAKQPLAFNLLLINAARNQSEWMLDEQTFTHVRPDGTSPDDRMREAGYEFVSPYRWGENIAWNGTTGALDLTAAVRQMEETQLFVNQSNPTRSHRINLMDGRFREVGLGILTGDFDGFHAAMATQNFAASATLGDRSFLTGVAYDDSLALNDDFYTPGEGLGGIAITATRLSDNATFQTTTWSSGGYTLALPAGVYRVTGVGEALGEVAFTNVTIADQNVKLDFTASDTPAPPPAPLSISGTAGNDIISASVSNGLLTVTVNGQATVVEAGQVTILQISAGDGNDLITMASSVLLPCSLLGGAGRDTIYGSGGADTIRGGSGNDLIRSGDGSDLLFGDDGLDTLWGGAGRDVLRGGLKDDLLCGEEDNDTLYGDDGSDRLQGGTANDSLLGGVGNDSLQGQGGQDRLFGGSGNDTLDGGAGRDRLDGSSGDDVFFARDSEYDTLLGGDGADRARRDSRLDTLSSITRFF